METIGGMAPPLWRELAERYPLSASNDDIRTMQDISRLAAKRGPPAPRPLPPPSLLQAQTAGLPQLWRETASSAPKVGRWQQEESQLTTSTGARVLASASHLILQGSILSWSAFL